MVNPASPAEPSDSQPARAGWSGGDRRATQRLTLLIRTAKAISKHGEFFCIVRDASSEGVRLKLFHPLPEGDEFDLVLPNGERHTINKVWQDGDHAGFRFASPVDIDRLVAETQPHLRKQEISLSCLIPGVVFSKAGAGEVHLFEISQFGARIECELHLAIGERVRLECDRLPPLDAIVHSRRAPFYALLFDHAFGFDEIARMCGVVESPAPEQATVPESAMPPPPQPLG